MAGAAGSGSKGARDAAVSRRKVLAGTGAAVAGGAILAGGTVAGAPLSAGATDGIVGVAPPGVNAVEFRGRIYQTGAAGEHFAGLGWFTALAGADRADLFSDPSKLQPPAADAKLAFYAAGDLVSRVLDQSVHALDITGTLDVYELVTPGVAFPVTFPTDQNPLSPPAGRRVASYAMTLQDVLAVFAPGHGIPTLSGDVRQTFAGRLRSGAPFGLRGSRARLLAMGLGTLVDPVTLNAQLEMAGNWTFT